MATPKSQAVAEQEARDKQQATLDEILSRLKRVEQKLGIAEELPKAEAKAEPESPQTTPVQLTEAEKAEQAAAERTAMIQAESAKTAQAEAAKAAKATQQPEATATPDVGPDTPTARVQASTQAKAAEQVKAGPTQQGKGLDKTTEAARQIKQGGKSEEESKQFSVGRRTFPKKP